jgi:hypothetical protein
MKICLHSKAPRQQGGVLVLTILLFAVAAADLVVYFLLTQNQYTIVARAQSYNNALVMAEAGGEDALALINKNAGSFNMISGWASGATTLDGWDTTNQPNYAPWGSSGTFYHMNRRVLATNEDYYDVYINPSGSTYNGPEIYSVGNDKWIATRTTFQNTNAVRKIIIKTMVDGLLRGALVALTTIDFKGQNVTIDSFNSLDPNHSHWQNNQISYLGTNYGVYFTNESEALSYSADGTYKRRANGDVCTDGLVINVGNADVYGHVDTAPGGTANLNSGGSVGSVAWVSTATSGIQPGYARDDMNYTFPDVLPPTNVWTLAGNGNTTVSINSPGNYRLAGQQTKSVFINASNVVLYAPGGIKFSGANVVQINTNCSLKLYTGGDIDTGSGTFNNLTQWSLNSAIYGLPATTVTGTASGNAFSDTVPGCLNIKLGGNGAGTGYVYAPESSLQFSGGGSGTYDVVGAFVAHDIMLNGHFNFHYDEALGLLGPAKGYIPKIWQEVQ